MRKKIGYVVLALLCIVILGYIVMSRINRPAKKDIYVHHEWGKLEEAIVGTGNDLVIPGYSEYVSFIYDPKYIDMMKEYGGMKAMDVDPEATKKLVSTIVARDEKDGKTYLKLPVESEKAVENVLGLIGNLMKSLN